MPKYNRLRGMAAAAAVWATAVVLPSCKENTIIPTGAVPAVDNITVFGDTLDLYTKTIPDDSLITSLYADGVSIYMGAGSITSDAFCGKITERFFFQVRPPQDNYNFDQNKYQIDSAVLILPYSGFSYGDTTNSAVTQTFEAFRVTEDFKVDSGYYSKGPDFNAETTPIGSVTVSLRDLVRSKYDSTRVWNNKRAPHLRMRLDDTKIMNELIGKANGGAEYVNTTSFLSYFKGIKITAKETGNTIPYFLLNGNAELYNVAGIVMYYHTKNSGGTITDTLMASYPFDATKCGFFNKVVREYNGTPVDNLFKSTAVTDNMFVITNQPGAGADIRIVNFDHIKKAIVNKAELVITQITAPMDQVFAVPSRIYPKGVNASGGTYIIADRYPLGSVNPLAFIDGNLRTANIGGMLVNQYVLNIPRELERAIADQKKELRLRINGTQSFAGAYRLVAGGSNYSMPQYRISLRIVYTKI